MGGVRGGGRPRSVRRTSTIAISKFALRFEGPFSQVIQHSASFHGSHLTTDHLFRLQELLRRVVPGQNFHSESNSFNSDTNAAAAGAAAGAAAATAAASAAASAACIYYEVLGGRFAPP